LDKVFSYQSGEDLLNRVDFDSKKQIENKNRDATSEEIKGFDLGRNVRGDQRSRSEAQRQEEIKGADQRRNVRGDQRSRSETQRQRRSKEPIRDATSEEIKGADQRRNVRGDQRSRSESQRQEEISGDRL
jgi:hypothetical protein